MSTEQIDRDKLRAAVRRLGDQYAFYILDEAIDLLPQTKLKKLVKWQHRLNAMPLRISEST